MKRVVQIVCAIVVVGMGWCLVEFLSRMLFNSRVERLGERGLPKVFVENQGVIHCRMKADDFRFPLPPGTHVLTSAVTDGGFDWADGAVQIQFEGTNAITADQYKSWLSDKLQIGASITAEPLPRGLVIKFHYFGDK